MTVINSILLIATTTIVTALAVLLLFLIGLFIVDEIKSRKKERIKKGEQMNEVFCEYAEHDTDGCLGFSNDPCGYTYCDTCLECPEASINKAEGGEADG